MSVPQVQQDEGTTHPVAHMPRPALTYLLMLVLALVYVGEATIHAGISGGFFDPSVQTLVAWGGMSHALVIEKGEWYRLLTAAFLHGGLAHLAMNSLALFVTGSALEPFIGRRWFAALYLLSAVGGGLASVTFNPPNIVGVGASGAIMGLFGFILIIAFRFPKGEVRSSFIANSVSALVFSTLPALFPLLTGGSALPIDYAAHGGGALVGAVIGVLFLIFWRRHERYPPLAAIAVAVSVAATGVLGWGARELYADFAEQSFAAQLMPDDRQPATDEAARAQADEIIKRYPNDPRGYFYKALVQADAGNTKAMETNARKAVELVEKYPGIFRDRFRARVRMVHALSLKNLNRTTDARDVAAPVCKASSDTQIVDILKKNGLC